jgi:transcriptional antiterminator RfaH
VHHHWSVFSDVMSSTNPTPPPLPGEGPHWFCVRAKPKHEHIAAAHLRLMPEIEVFLPRIRFERPFKGTKIWVTEALFPNYLFARFNIRQGIAQIRYSAGVQTIVHFGLQIPVIPDPVIASLKAELGTEAIRQVDPGFAVGEEIKIVGGPFGGLQALITRVLPARQRVAVLLDFLGRQVMVEVETDAILKTTQPRARPLLPLEEPPETPC